MISPSLFGISRLGDRILSASFLKRTLWIPWCATEHFRKSQWKGKFMILAMSKAWLPLYRPRNYLMRLPLLMLSPAMVYRCRAFSIQQTSFFPLTYKGKGWSTSKTQTKPERLPAVNCTVIYPALFAFCLGIYGAEAFWINLKFSWLHRALLRKSITCTLLSSLGLLGLQRQSSRAIFTERTEAGRAATCMPGTGSQHDMQ